MEFKEIVNKRYATKKFNSNEIPEDKVNELLELIRMTPSSYGLQPWKIKIIKDKETKEKLLSSSYNQEQITTCSHLLVFCANKDINGNIDKYEKMLIDVGTPEENAKKYTDMMRDFENGLDDPSKKCWTQKQTYLAIGNAVNGAKSLGFDSCPMEGFLPDKYQEFLNIPDNLIPTALVTIGFAADEPKPKLRYSKEEMFF
jgi:nitroreductase / dihydropteridine reductase